MTVNVTKILNVTYVKTPTITGESTIMQDGSLNLTCTGDSFPPFDITWTKPGINKTLNSKTGPGTSTLVIHNVTEEHSGQYVCSANHLNTTLFQDINITVINETKLVITGETTVTEGNTLNLTCTGDIFPSSLITWTKNGMNKTLNNETQSNGRRLTLVIHNMTAEDSGLYLCTAKLQNNTLTEKVDVLVKYQKGPEITGKSVVTEGHDLNLTCSLDSWPLSIITWTKTGLSTALKNGSRSARLVIFNITTEDSGQYLCTAKHPNKTLTTKVDVLVTLLPKILDESGCEAQLEVLTCLCISQGFPSPTITWERLENHVEYSVDITVSNHTVKSIIFLNVKDNSSIPVVCVSSNRNGETRRNLNIRIVEDQGRLMTLLRTVTQMGTIIPFLIGLLLSAAIFSLLSLCCRKKQKSYGSAFETLEMVTQETNGSPEEDYQPIQTQGTAGGYENPEAGTSEIEYSDINLLLLKQEIQSPAEEKSKKAETDYAKIKIKGPRFKGEGEGEGQEQEEVKLCVPETVESEAVAVYSNMTSLMDQM
ncbi:hypothetical protein CHARACLAT_005057 [Characodon lateralis]|uniref:Ig-like domain-containing protein n=1 Tax=Characodon lateralis TaxID=208331 RepID=A0ABU7EHX6_9TELE|nr:hypothetical protein [Characodon lateralis]